MQGCSPNCQPKAGESHYRMDTQMELSFSAVAGMFVGVVVVGVVTVVGGFASIVCPPPSITPIGSSRDAPAFLPVSLSKCSYQQSRPVQCYSHSLLFIYPLSILCCGCSPQLLVVTVIMYWLRRLSL